MTFSKRQHATLHGLGPLAGGCFLGKYFSESSTAIGQVHDGLVAGVAGTDSDHAGRSHSVWKRYAVPYLVPRSAMELSEYVIYTNPLVTKSKGIKGL